MPDGVNRGIQYPASADIEGIVCPRLTNIIFTDQDFRVGGKLASVGFEGDRSGFYIQGFDIRLGDFLVGTQEDIDVGYHQDG